MPFDPVLDAVTRAAVDGTGAARGWVVAPEGDGLRVAASAGGEDPGRLLDARVDGPGGTAGLGASRPATTEASALTTVTPASTFFTMDGFMTSPCAK